MAEEKISSNAGKISTSRWSSTEDIIYPFVNRLLSQTETVVDPSLSEAHIFQILTKNIVDFFEAESASIWLFENDWQNLASFFRQENLFENYEKDQLAENMGGKIDVEVKDGFVIFRVKLPALQR